MAVWSSLALKYNQNINATKHAFRILTNGLKGKVTNGVPVRYCHERTLPIRTSMFEYYKLKNLLHFYFMIGIVPIVLLVTYVNIFIGPAELALIPEGYEPQPWEYHKHPITRFFSKYFLKSPQEVHEKNLHYIFYKKETSQLRQLQSKVQKLMRRRDDYQAWYFRDPMVKYYRKMLEESDESYRSSGIKGKWID